MQPTLTKSELIELISNKIKLPKGKAEQIVNCIFDSMVDALKKGEGIEIRGFGSFTVREYKSYEGRNPRTGTPGHVGAPGGVGRRVGAAQLAEGQEHDVLRVEPPAPGPGDEGAAYAGLGARE